MSVENMSLNVHKLSYFYMKTCCGYLLELPQLDNYNKYPQHIFFGEVAKLSQNYQNTS